MVQKLCKRGLPLLLCVVLLASLLCVGAAAADTESNVAMNVTTTGDTVSVTVSVKEGTTISSAGLGIFFDTDLLECTSIVSGFASYPTRYGLTDATGFTVSASAYSTLEDAAREGTVGFSIAGTEDVEYAESVAFTATFTAIADGTAAFALYEDSKGADGCKSDAVDTVSVTISDGNITINVSSVTLDKTEAALTVGETLTLTATV
ncbi:MAG: hypothetical protein LIO54_02370, partial [Oscillospiraceae bacterium]|nr:hypothetical protein [Oscillospiraceae bacterium]